MNINNKRILTILIAVHTIVVSYADGIRSRVETVIEQPTCSTYGTMIINKNGISQIVVLPKLSHDYGYLSKCNHCGTERSYVTPYTGKPAESLIQVNSTNYREFGFTDKNWDMKNGHYAISNADELMAYLERVTSPNNPNSIGASAFLTDDVLFDTDINLPVRSIPSGVVLDGMGHLIKGLSCKTSALFAHNGGKIANLGLILPTFTSDANAKQIGFIAVTNTGTVANCFVLQGKLIRKSENTKLGGIVGANEGGAASVENCYMVANTVNISSENSCIYNCEAFLDSTSYKKRITDTAFLDSLNKSGYGDCIPWYTYNPEATFKCTGVPTLTGDSRWVTPTHFVQEKEATCYAEGYDAHWVCDWCGEPIREGDHGAFHYCTRPQIPHDLVKHEATGTVSTCLNPHPYEYWHCRICDQYYKVSDASETFKFQLNEPHNHNMTKVPSSYDCLDGGYEEHWACADCHNIFTDGDPATDRFITTDSTIRIRPNVIEENLGTLYHQKLDSESERINEDISLSGYSCIYTPVQNYAGLSMHFDYSRTVPGDLYNSFNIEVLRGATVIASEINSSRDDHMTSTVNLGVVRKGEPLEIRIMTNPLQFYENIDINVTAEYVVSHVMLEDEHPGALLGICSRCNHMESPRIHQGLGTADIPLVGNIQDGFAATIPIELNGDNEYNSDIEFSAPMVSYSCDSTSKEIWSPLYLPFDINVENNLFSHCEFAIVQNLRFTDSEGRFIDGYVPGCSLVVTAQMVELDYVIPANTLALVRPRHAGAKLTFHDVQMMPSAEQTMRYTAGHFNFDFTGSLHTYTSNGWWVLNDKEGFDYFSSPQLLKPYGWYMTNASGDDADADDLLKNAKLYVIEIGGNDTPVKDIHDNVTGGISAATGIYNLQGQQVTVMQKGQIYIINGKKIYTHPH